MNLFEKTPPRVSSQRRAWFADFAKLERASEANLRGLGYGE